MEETYEQIVEEIKLIDDGEWSYARYFSKHGLDGDAYSYQVTPFALDLIERVRDAVGGDPSQWYILDADGNQVHIGDDVRNDYNNVFTVRYFKLLSESFVVCYDGDDNWDFPHSVHKVISDTQEQIDADAELSAMAYCLKYELESTDEGETTSILKTRHILERQRRLDGVDNA